MLNIFKVRCQLQKEKKTTWYVCWGEEVET